MEPFLNKKWYLVPVSFISGRALVVLWNSLYRHCLIKTKTTLQGDAKCDPWDKICPTAWLSVSVYHNPDIFRKFTSHLCTATEWCNTTNQNSPVIMNELVCTSREFDDCNASTLQTRGQRQKLMHAPIITNEADYTPSACNGSLKTYSPSGHPRFRWVCFFTSTDLEKWSSTSLAHQWILCSEWVPSEWEFIS